MSLPLEFRLAIGASCTHDSFDGTLILSLCSDDPWVNGDHGGNLVTVNVRDGIDPDFAVRLANSPTNPRTLYSTGYGVRLGWDINIRVRTSRLGILPMNANPRPEINDGSLWHLASIIAMSRTLTDFEPGTLYPPYLFLTTNYQHWDELWLPVEVDPNNTTAPAPGPIEFNPETKTAERAMHLRLVTRDPYRLALPAYVPSLVVFDVPGLIVEGMPDLVPGTGDLAGSFVTQLTLNVALPTTLPQAPDGLGVMDHLLVNLNTSAYGWKLFTIQGVDGTRKIIDVSTLTNMSNSLSIPPAPACDAVRGVIQSQVYMPTYCLQGFPGQAIPSRGQIPLTGARLIGGAGCPPA
jgi:hypothetical protein